MEALDEPEACGPETRTMFNQNEGAAREPRRCPGSARSLRQQAVDDRPVTTIERNAERVAVGPNDCRSQEVRP